MSAYTDVKVKHEVDVSLCFCCQRTTVFKRLMEEAGLEEDEQVSSPSILSKSVSQKLLGSVVQNHIERNENYERPLNLQRVNTSEFVCCIH